jgi:AcrR family transcriptional regulator
MIRNTDVKPLRRTYTSDLRDEQADATRTRILEALVRTMASGLAALSIPAVAREAGVSIPTIYRHFGSKQGLVEALNPYVLAKAGLMPDQLPETPADFEPMARRMFRNLAGMDLTLRAAMASELGQQVRQATMPRRLGVIREVVGRFAPDLSEGDRDRIANLALILMSTPAFHAYKDYLGLGPDGSAELVSWAVRTLIDGARKHAPEREVAR